MTSLEQISFQVRSRDQELSAGFSHSSDSKMGEPNRPLIEASNPSQPSSGLSKATALSSGPCHMCADLHRQMQYIANRLDGLLADVRDVPWDENFKPLINEEIENRKSRLEPVINSLHQLISWILESIETISRILSLANKDSPRITDGSSYAEKKMRASYVATGAKRKSSFLDGQREPLSLPSMSYRSDSRSREGSSSYISDEDWNRKLSDESSTSHSTISATGNYFVPSELPSQMFSKSRVLPPLPPSNSSLPSLSPTTLTESATLMAHLQELQNRIEARALAYETLQREHQSLLSAFTRSQTRIAVLDKRSSATNSEIRGLHDGRAKLEAQIESLEAQVGDLQQSRDDARAQSIAKGAQYMHIMAMSTKLEAKGVSDSQKWKAERKTWELERKAFMQQIATLETEKSVLLCKLDGTGALEFSGTCSHIFSADETVDDGKTSASPRILQHEVEELQMKCQKLQSALQALHLESGHFDEALERLGGIGKRLQHQLRTTYDQTSPLFGNKVLDLNGREHGVSSD